MTNHELEQRIRTAAEHAAPDCLDKILSSCSQHNTVNSTPVCKAHTEGQMEGEIINMSEMENKNTRYQKIRHSFVTIAAAAAALILCFGGYRLFQSNITPSVDSVVMLDVNPSLSLSVDAGEKVLSVDALNDDAKEVLGNMELKNTSLEVAVNAIIGSMLQKGYLNNSQNTILVSVENEDAARGEALQQKVTEAIAGATQNAALDAAVLSQLVSAGDASLEELADQYSVSLGKAALIQEVIVQVPDLTFADLAPMTINEIALIAASKNVSSASVTQSGSASDTAFIGQEAALKAACEHAGVTAEEILKMEVEFDSKNGTLIYEVEFETATKKGEYEIDATTAEILKSELKQRDDAVDDSGYISAAAAKEAALAHAGVTAEEILKIEVELDSDDHMMIYEVEFETSTNKYEYKIDAVTGAIVNYESKNQKNTSSGGSGSETSPVNETPSASETPAASVNSPANEESSASETPASNETSPVKETPSVSETPTVSETSPVISGYISESAAKEAALAHAGVTESSTTYLKCYLEYKSGKPANYCVEFKVNRTEYEYEIDLYTGAVLDYEVESHDPYDGSVDSASGASEGTSGSVSTSYIGESAALAAALENAGVTESSLKEKHVELDQHGDTMIYEVEFETGDREYEYEIDAVTGAILKSEKH